MTKEKNYDKLLIKLGENSGNMKKNTTLQSKLYSMFIVSVIIPLGIAIFAILFYTSYENQKRERKDMDNVLRSTSQNIENQFEQLKNIGDTFYMQNRVFQVAEWLNKPELYAYYDQLYLTQLENDYCITMTKLLYMAGQDLRGVVIFPVNSEKQVGYYLGKESAVLMPMSYENYQEEEWFVQAVKQPEKAFFLSPHQRNYMKDKNQQPVYSLVRAIRNMDNNAVIAVIKVDSGFQEITNSINIVEGGKEKGIALSNGDEIVAQSESLDKKIDLDTKRKKAEIGGRKYYARALEIGGTGWNLYYLYSLRYSMRGYLLAVAVFFAVIFSGTGLALLIYRQRSREMIADIGQITKTLRQVEKGDLDTSIEIHSDTEVGVIAAGINRMIHNLKCYIEQEYLMVIQNQKAEYRALQSQINPHFLYNTLNGFVALNRMGEKRKLEQSIISLSHLFQYTCRKQDTAFLRDEFHFLEEYLKLEKLKLDERLEYMLWLEPECENFVIPKLLLQPIVENSIVHGMGNTDTSIMITVIASESEIKGIGKVVIISVRDNGVGFDSSVKIDEKEHTGVANVKARAELYSKDVVYQHTSVPGEGTKTTFVFLKDVCKG